MLIPAETTPQNTPTDGYFDDVDQVFMRSDWSDKAFRARLWAGSVFGKQGSKIAKRYNWAHCAINQGSFVLSQGKHEIILEAGWTRDYRKTAASNNCIIVNDTDQWGGGQVWHARLEQELTKAQTARDEVAADLARLEEAGRAQRAEDEAHMEELQKALPKCKVVR